MPFRWLRPSGHGTGGNREQSGFTGVREQLTSWVIPPESGSISRKNPTFAVPGRTAGFRPSRPLPHGSSPPARCRPTSGYLWPSLPGNRLRARTRRPHREAAPSGCRTWEPQRLHRRREDGDQDHDRPREPKSRHVSSSRVFWFDVGAAAIHRHAPMVAAEVRGVYCPYVVRPRRAREYPYVEWRTTRRLRLALLGGKRRVEGLEVDSGSP
jgi:hypothetical protein